MRSGVGTASAPPVGAAVSNPARTATLVAAGAGVVLPFVRFGMTSRALVAAVLLGALAALAVIDFVDRRVPTRLVLPAAAAVLALQVALFPDDTAEWVAAALITGGALLGLSMLKRDSLDAGDAQVGLLLGAGLGTDALYAILVGCLALWPVAAYLVLQDGVDARKRAIPLTPALAFGAAVVVLAG